MNANECVKNAWSRHPSLLAPLSLPRSPLAAAGPRRRYPTATANVISASAGPDGDVLYRSFFPEFASPLYPGLIELVKRCRRRERGEVDRVGATIFPVGSMTSINSLKLVSSL
jgi:hypothetical protein